MVSLILKYEGIVPRKDNKLTIQVNREATKTISLLVKKTKGCRRFIRIIRTTVLLGFDEKIFKKVLIKK